MGKSFLHRKETIVLTTIDLIDKLGVHAVTTREIAKNQGISEGAIFKHFETKNDLFIGVLDFFSRFDADIIRTTELKEMNSREALFFLFNTYATYYENYPSITALLQSFGILRFEPKLQEAVDSIFDARINFIVEKIEQGKLSGEIATDVDPELIAQILLGTSWQICYSWRIKKYAFSLQKKTNEAIENIFGIIF